MIRAPYSVFLTLLISVFSYFQTCEDITFDYPSHPYHPFDITHAEIQLEIESDQHLVNGVVMYSITSKIQNVTELQLHSGELSLDQITSADEDLEFKVNADSLFITLNDTLNAGDKLELTIAWQSTSKFGLHKSSKGSFFSSMNPLAHRHWLPGFDHPRETFTFNASFDIPNDHEVFFNGELGETSPVSATKKRVRWSSDEQVPATGLGFVSGNFLISELTAGFTKIRIFHPSNRQEEATNLVVEAARLKKEIEDVLSFEYPWPALNIVQLEDNFWMERTHGTGTIYLFDRLGKLDHQLARGMYAQWFGEYQRTEQYLNLENEGENGLLSTSLHFQLMDSSAIIENPDSLIMIEDWNKWQESYKKQSITFTQTIDQSLTGFMRSFAGLIDFDDYAEVWYQQTGIPNYNPVPSQSSSAVVSDSSPAKYAMDVNLDEIESEITLAFQLIEGEGDQLHSISMIAHQFDAVSSSEITFTGLVDSVTISIPVTTEFVTFESADYEIENLEISEAPLFYLLNQLRSDDPGNRIAAANLLVNHSANPDLQLALSDILSFEENDEVIAAIYGSLAAITNGATGTEEQFIAGLSNDSQAIQLASIMALKNYPTNEYVRSSLSSKVIRSEGELFETGLNVLNELASTSEMESLLRSVERRDTVGFKTLMVLSAADSLHQNELALSIATEFLSSDNTYAIRKAALEYLSLFDTNSENWNNRLDELVNDRDPRIRFWAVEHAARFKSSSEALVFVSSAEVDEFDPRVLIMIEGIKEELAD